MHQSFIYHFEWDPIKARGNLRKHGVAFERAATVFKDPKSLSQFDNEHSSHEDRWVTLGIDRNGVLLVVCHTYWDEARDESARIRIISARKATKNEIKQYKELQ